MSRTLGRILILAAAFALLVSMVPVPAAAQGLLIHIESAEPVPLPRPIIIHAPYPHHRLPRPVPQPASTYKIKSLEVNTRLADQVAKVQVSQSFVNTGSRQMEVCFVFPLPYDGAIDQLTLLVDGKEFPAKLLDAKEARKQLRRPSSARIRTLPCSNGWAPACLRPACSLCRPVPSAKSRFAIRSFAASSTA